MAATFGSPVSAVLLAIELLLFEYRPRSLDPGGARQRRRGRRAHRCSSAPRRSFAMPDLADAGGAALAIVRRARRDRRARRRRSSRAPSTRSRTRFEHLPDPLDVVAGDRRASRSASSATSRRARSASATTTSSDIARRRSIAGRRAARCSCVLEVRLVVDRARQRHVGRHAGAAVHHRRRARRAARRGSAAAAFPHVGIDLRIARAGRHGGDLRRRVARAAGLGRVRVRDDAPAARPAAAARRLHRVVPRLVRC